jgi:hypothetical protein
MEAFNDAVQKHDAAGLRTLLAAHPELRAAIDRPVFGAAAPAIVEGRGDRAMLDVLLEFGADINARSPFWGRAVGVLDDTNPEQAAWLIERGAIVDIHAAAGLGMLEKVREWLASDPSLLHAPGGDGQRPLHFARTKEIIDVLLDHGADINARDVDHQSTAAQYKVNDKDLCGPGTRRSRNETISITGSSQRRRRCCWSPRNTADGTRTICSSAGARSRSSSSPRACSAMKRTRSRRSRRFPPW